MGARLARCLTLSLIACSARRPVTPAPSTPLAHAPEPGPRNLEFRADGDEGWSIFLPAGSLVLGRERAVVICRAATGSATIALPPTIAQRWAQHPTVTAAQASDVTGDGKEDAVLTLTFDSDESESDEESGWESSAVTHAEALVVVDLERSAAHELLTAISDQFHAYGPTNIDDSNEELTCGSPPGLPWSARWAIPCESTGGSTRFVTVESWTRVLCVRYERSRDGPLFETAVISQHTRVEGGDEEGSDEEVDAGTDAAEPDCS